MGLFFQANTWRAPLQLIDCWLPEPAADAHKHPPTPRPTHTSAALMRFARAGWLGHPAANGPAVDSPLPRARVIRGHGRGSRSDGRVVVAGRVDEVCAALDQLAARDEAERGRHAARA